LYFCNADRKEVISLLKTEAFTASALLLNASLLNAKIMKKQNEIWKNITGYEGYYQVSNYGYIKSLERKDRLGRIVKEKIRKSCKNNPGYLFVPLSKNGKVKNGSIHRLVALAFIPNPKNKPEVNHKNGIKTDNRVENLEWNTPKENIEHSYLAGLQPDKKGEKAANSELTEFQVLAIRRLYKINPKFNRTYVGKKLNYNPKTISNIINRRI
jgi:hypothetical protein